MKSGFRGISLPPGTPLPTNEFFHVNTFAGGYDSRDAQEDLPPGSSPSMLDMEVSQDDRLIRAPGVTQTETLAHAPTQVILQPGFKYASEMLLLKAPYIGVKTTGSTVWTDVGLRQGVQGYTNFAGVALISNGVGGIYSRQPRATKIEKIPEAPSAFGLTVFADRVVLGGTRVSDSMDFMGIGWSDATSDYKGWDIAQGAGAETMIGSQHTADRFQAFAPNGFNTLAILNRRSIWIATPTGDVFEPMNIVPRLEDTGCVSAATVVPTEYGTLFLSDDGVRLFTGNDVPIVSAQINADLAISETLKYSASFDPTRKRYYLHTPTETWVFDMVRRRWFRWAGVFTASLFFPAQGARGTRWSEAQGTWGTQTKAWWQFLNYESGGSMQFVKDLSFGQEDAVSSSVFGVPLTPQWFDRRVVGDNQDMLMTAVNTRFTYEAAAPAQIQVWLPDKPDGNPEPVATGTLAPGSATKRTQIPLIHTGRAISLGLKILSGSPRIRKAAVEYQQTGMLWEGNFEIPVVQLGLDAILRPRLIFIDSLGAGKAQSIGGGSEFAAQLLGRYDAIGGAFTFSTTGGRDGGGYIQGVVADSSVRINAVAPLSPQGGLVTAHDLNGAAVTVPRRLQTFGQVTLFILPDYTLRVGWTTDISGTIFEYIGDATTYTVPATGEFLLETHFSLSPQFKNRGGFVTVNLYTPSGPAIGDPIIRAIGVRTYDLNLTIDPNNEQFGVYSGPAGGRILGIGLLDANAEVQRYMGKLHFVSAFPTADGDVVQSLTHYEHKENYHLDSNGNPLLVGTDLVWGATSRWSNVRSLLHSADSGVEPLIATVDMGEVSGFTDRWLNPAGPVYPTNPDPITRNSIINNGLDRLVVSHGQQSVVEIEAISPFILHGYRKIRGTNSGFPAFGDILPWVFTGPDHTESSTAVYRGRPQHGFVLGLKTPEGLAVAGRKEAAHGATEPAEWRCLQGYTLTPPSVLSLNPSTNRPWGPGSLPQVSVQGDFTALDAIVGLPIEDRWVHVDVGQLGLDIAFRTSAFPNVTGSKRPPVVDLVIRSQTLSAGLVSVYDASVDFNGRFKDLLTGIVSRVLDWGDGSGTVALLAGSPSANFVSHNYTLHGTYEATLQVTNAFGLTAVATTSFVIPIGTLTADFSRTTNTDDVSGLTIDFSDSSTVPLGTITSRLWNFGDGATSTVQNPSHIFAAPGDYNVTLTVADDTGRTESHSSTVTVPIGGGAYVEPGVARTMPIDFSSNFNTDAHTEWETSGRGYVNVDDPADVFNPTGGIGGTGCGEEHDPGGPNFPAYWEFIPVFTMGIAAHHTQFYLVARFNLAGKTIAADTPIVQGWPAIFGLVITPTRTVKILVDNGSGTPVSLGESTTAVIPATGYCRIDLRGHSDDSGGGFAWVRVSTNPAVKGDLVEFVPAGGGTAVRHFDSIVNLQGTISGSIPIGTGSSDGDWGIGTWPGTMIDGVQWDDVFILDPTGFGDFDWADNA